MKYDCGICREPLVSGEATKDPTGERNVSAIGCGHLFHFVCLQTRLSHKATCPKCQRPVHKDKIIRKLFFECEDVAGDTFLGLGVRGPKQDSETQIPSIKLVDNSALVPIEIQANLEAQSVERKQSVETLIHRRKRDNSEMSESEACYQKSFLLEDETKQVGALVVKRFKTNALEPHNLKFTTGDRNNHASEISDVTAHHHLTESLRLREELPSASPQLPSTETSNQNPPADNLNISQLDSAHQQERLILLQEISKLRDMVVEKEATVVDLKKQMSTLRNEKDATEKKLSTLQMHNRAKLFELISARATIEQLRLDCVWSQEQKGCLEQSNSNKILKNLRKKIDMRLQDALCGVKQSNEKLLEEMNAQKLYTSRFKGTRKMCKNGQIRDELEAMHHKIRSERERIQYQAELQLIKANKLITNWTLALSEVLQLTKPAGEEKNMVKSAEAVKTGKSHDWALTKPISEEKNTVNSAEAAKTRKSQEWKFPKLTKPISEKKKTADSAETVKTRKSLEWEFPKPIREEKKTAKNAEAAKTKPISEEEKTAESQEWKFTKPISEENTRKRKRSDETVESFAAQVECTSTSSQI